MIDGKTTSFQGSEPTSCRERALRRQHGSTTSLYSGQLGTAPGTKGWSVWPMPTEPGWTKCGQSTRRDISYIFLRGKACVNLELSNQLCLSTTLYHPEKLRRILVRLDYYLCEALRRNDSYCWNGLLMHELWAYSIHHTCTRIFILTLYLCVYVYTYIYMYICHVLQPEGCHHTSELISFA